MLRRATLSHSTLTEEEGGGSPRSPRPGERLKQIGPAECLELTNRFADAFL